MSAYLGRCLLHPTTGFIYKKISIRPPRAKDAKAWYMGKVSDIIAGIPLPYRSVHVWSALDRPNDGKSMFPQWTSSPAVALHDPISSLYIIVWMPWISREEPSEYALSREQDTDIHVEVCEQQRWIVTFIIRCSNDKVPRVVSATHSSKRTVTWLMIGIIPLPDRAARYRSCDRPGGGISFDSNLDRTIRRGTCSEGDVPMKAYAAKRPLHPAIIFIYGYRDLAMPRVSRAEELSLYDNNISNDNGILEPYLAASKGFLGRQGGGIVSLRTQKEPSAAASLRIKPFSYAVIRMLRTPENERYDDRLSYRQDSVPYVKRCELHRSMVSFIVRSSNDNVPRALGTIRSGNGSITCLTNGIIPLLHRAGHSWLLIDRPGGGIFFYRISKYSPPRHLFVMGHLLIQVSGSRDYSITA